MPRGAAERNRGTNEYFGTPARGFRLAKNKSGANRTFLVSPATRDFGRILAIRNHGEHHERRFFMARSSNLSEGMRDLAQEGAEQARRMADFGVFGMRDFAEHSVGQARQAFDGFLSATQRTMATFDQQASDIRQKTLSLAAGTIANSFEFTQRLLQARSAEELVQLQAEFAEAQMHAWADQTRELGQTVVRTATDAMKTTVGSMQSAADWNRIQGNWKQLKGKVKEKWGKLTADDLDTIEGRRDQLEGKIQDRYGYTADQVRREVDSWYRSMRH